MVAPIPAVDVGEEPASALMPRSEGKQRVEDTDARAALGSYDGAARAVRRCAW